MASNYPGPYEIRIEYVELGVGGLVINHVQRLNIALVETVAQGDIFANYDIIDADGATVIALNTVVEAYLVLFNDLFSTGMDIISVELWKYPTPQSFDSVFWATYTAIANAGTNGGGAQASAQSIFVFRSAEGGILKLSLMESVDSPGTPEAYAGLGTEAALLVDFVLDGDGSTFTAPFLARDTSYPFSFNRHFPGQNEGLWKRRNGR